MDSLQTVNELVAGSRQLVQALQGHFEGEPEDLWHSAG